MGLRSRRELSTKAGLGAEFGVSEEERRSRPTRGGAPMSENAMDKWADCEWCDSKIAQRVAAKSLARGKRWMAVATVIPADRRASQREMYEWVAAHLRCEPEVCDPLGIPCVAAVNMMLTALESEAATDRFWVQYRLATSGSGGEAEVERRFETDGEKKDRFMLKVDKMYGDEESRLAVVK